ncbi:dUTP diphosphatase [Corynebacterium sp. A21]|uniref:dUTP diphosphatase n=1 Tax=Corynebacterium sp. A21 TaxID=3457318 RepID=UPI003FD5EAF9
MIQRIREWIYNIAIDAALDMEGAPVKFTTIDRGYAPTRATDGSSAWDLRANYDVILDPGQRHAVRTGVAVELPQDTHATLLSRSGWGKKYGITLANSVGLIDTDYRGEIIAVLINHGDTPINIERGDRIAQLLIQRSLEVSFTEVDALTTTDRGTGGFGHTGTK